VAIVRLHIAPAWKGKKLNQIKRADVKKLLLQKQQAGSAPKTVENIKALISGIFTNAFEEELLQVKTYDCRVKNSSYIIFYMAKRKKKYHKNNSSKPKRNAPCPCGSGLKYKKCCGASNKSFKVRTQNKPEVINYHLVSPNGGKTWEKKPGNLSAIICGVKPENIDKNVYSIISKTMEASSDSKLKNKLIDCLHKLKAVNYHLSTIKTEIKDRVKKYEDKYSAGSGVSFEIENQRLVYETEAFLFQVKSSLDLLIKALGYSISPLKNMNSISQAGFETLKILKENGFEELGNIFEHQWVEWIQELVKMRNTITHHSELKGFHCFIEKPYIGEEKVQIHYPTMPSGKRVDEYCQEVYDRLIELYESGLKYITN